MSGKRIAGLPALGIGTDMRQTDHKRSGQAFGADHVVGAAGHSSFPWAPSTMLTFTAQGEYPMAFPGECPLRLLFVQFSIEHRVTPSFHDYPELSLVCGGKGRFTVDRCVYEARPGDVLLVGSREFHRMEAD